MLWLDSLSALYGEGRGRSLEWSVPQGRKLNVVPPAPALTIMPMVGMSEHTSPICGNGSFGAVSGYSTGGKLAILKGK